MANPYTIAQLRQFAWEDIRALAHALKSSTFEPPVPALLSDGIEVSYDLDPTTRLCNTLVLMAFYTDSTEVHIARKGRCSVATYSGGPHPVSEVAMPGYVHSRLVMRWINTLEGNVTKNDALELEGFIPIKWGLDEKRNYRIEVAMRPEADGFTVTLRILPDPDT